MFTPSLTHSYTTFKFFNNSSFTFIDKGSLSSLLGLHWYSVSALHCNSINMRFPCSTSGWCPKFPTFTPDPNLQNPHLHRTQIYTEPKFTQLRFTQNQIYPALHWHTQIYTTHIYTKLNPNLHRPKFTQAQIYIHIFGQISSNPNSHDPNLHKTQIYTAQIYVTQIYTQLKIVLEPHATIVPKCMYGCDIISWLVR